MKNEIDVFSIILQAVGRKIANAHVLFNVLGVAVFAWFIPLFHRTLQAVVR